MMEEDLLKEMILDRETAIQFIETKISDQNEKEKRLRKEQILVKGTVVKNREGYRTELTKLRQRYGVFLRQYHDTKDMLDTKRAQHQQLHHSNDNTSSQQQSHQTNGGAKIPNVPGLHVYNEIMNSVDASLSSGNGSNGESSSNYVVRMQSQLCKAMHGMGIMETQLQLTRKQTDYYKKKSRDVITDMIEEKSQAELKLVNELIVADNSRVEVETKRKEQHDSFFTKKYDLVEKIERHLEAMNINSDDEEEEEEDNEEEKEELREVLEQGKEEIKRLERENDERAKGLEVLKEKATIAQGKDVVDDIVTSIAEEFAQDDDDDEYDSD